MNPYGQIQGTTVATSLGAVPKPLSQMQAHTNQLVEQASRLAALNTRLSEIIDRFAGAAPPNGVEAVKEAQPLGVLVCAQFEARRIAEGLDRLTDQINRLDQIA